MIIGNNKYVLFNFIPYEYKYLEIYLEKMALKGWKLDKISGNFFKFLKVEPQKLKYSVTLLEKASSMDEENSDTVLEYKEYYEKSGWNFVCENGKTLIFYCENYSENIEINIDERKKFKNISKESLKSIIPILVLTILFLITQYNATLGSYDCRFLADDSQLFLTSVICLFALNTLIEIISYLIWCIRGIKALKNSENVKYECYSIYKFRKISNNIVFYMLMFSLIVTLLIENGVELKGSIIIGIILYSVNIFIDFLSNYCKRKAMFFISLIIFIIVAISIVNITTFMNSDKGKYLSEEDKFPLTLLDFNDSELEENSYTSDDVETFSTAFVNEDTGIIADNLFYSNEGLNGELVYELFESNYNWAIKYKIRELMSDMKKYNLNYEIIESNLPDYIKVYKNEKADRYLLISNDKVIEISKYNNEQSEKELLDLVYKKVFKG